MTTMFVQLRRVVYLLVLLQFCVCVAYAQSDDDPDEAKVNENLENALKKEVTHAYTLFVDGSGCFSAWKDVVGGCKSSSEDVASASKKTEEEVGKIKRLREGASLSSGDSSTDLKTKEAVKNAAEAVNATIDAVVKMTSSVKGTRWVGDFCMDIVNNWNEEEKRFAAKRNSFSELLGKKIEETPERMILAINSSKIHKELTYLVGNLSAYKGNSSFVTRDSGPLRKVEDALKDAVTELKEWEKTPHNKGLGDELNAQIKYTREAGDKKRGEVTNELKRITFTRRERTTTKEVRAKLDEAKKTEKLRLEGEMEDAVKKLVEEEKTRREEAKRLEKEREEQEAQRAREAQEQKEREVEAQKAR
ncbi:uncharacterized protein TM35_001211000, partial [Trypanosoma theileri]